MVYHFVIGRMIASWSTSWSDPFPWPTDNIPVWQKYQSGKAKKKYQSGMDENQFGMSQSGMEKKCESGMAKNTSLA